MLNVLETLIAASLTGNSAVLRIRVLYVLRDVATSDGRYFVSLLEDLVANARSRTFLHVSITVHDTAASLLSASSTLDSLADWDNPFLSPGEKKQQRQKPSSSQEKRVLVTQRAGRPNLTTCLNHLLNDTQPESRAELGAGVAVVACGPHALIDSARRAARTCDQDMAYRA